MSEFVENAIFWIETDKINPNPYQPRREFNETHLRDLADSIRQYGVLQPLVVTKKEVAHEGGIEVSYELIAGERRLRASRLAGVSKVPAIIRADTQSGQIKLELAIIENLQREDLNPVDRAIAFARLVNEFSFTHTEVAKRVGKSREYVSNSLRLLTLPQDILDALSQGRISEGHARPLMMLNDRGPEQSTLFKEIMFKKLTVREAEEVARHIAHDKVRKKSRPLDPEIASLANELTQTLGTRVAIESRSIGGKVVIDFFSRDDLRALVDMLHAKGLVTQPQLAHFTPPPESTPHTGFYAGNTAPVDDNAPAESLELLSTATALEFTHAEPPIERESLVPKMREHHEGDVVGSTSGNDEKEEDPQLYSVGNFTV